MTMERLTTRDFIARLPFRSGGARGPGWPWRRVRSPDHVGLCCAHAVVVWRPLRVQRAPAAPSCALCEVDDVAHPALDDGIQGDASDPFPCFGAKCAHNVATGCGAMGGEGRANGISCRENDGSTLAH